MYHKLGHNEGEHDKEQRKTQTIYTQRIVTGQAPGGYAADANHSLRRQGK